jgi:hypothetical protein
MKFEEYEILLTMIMLRFITRGLIGFTGNYDVVTSGIYYLFAGSFLLSFIGVWKKKRWGFFLIMALSIIDGLLSLMQISSIDSVIKLGFWDVFPIYLAYKIYRINYVNPKINTHPDR